jgi:hypothetical protein
MSTECAGARCLVYDHTDVGHFAYLDSPEVTATDVQPFYRSIEKQVVFLRHA